MANISNPGMGGTGSGMGTDVGSKVEEFRSTVGQKVEELGERAEQKSREEGELTSKVDKVTASLPSTTWLVLAGASIAGSLGLKLLGRDKDANFVGMWAPTFLILGLYNKIVKVAGSDRRGGF
jgi:hypothetical protein